MNNTFTRYSAAGNLIGVAYYPDFRTLDEFVSAPKIRAQLKKKAAKANCDSVMVLVNAEKNRFALHTLVFEPNSEERYGGISTMCGNGVRAVASFAHQNLGITSWPLLIHTRSGILDIEKVSYTSFRVRMGSAITKRERMQAYLGSESFANVENLVDVALPEKLVRALAIPFGVHGPVFSAGYTTTDALQCDGEPHLVIELHGRAVRTLADLRTAGRRYGPVLCKDTRLFPQEMNINFVVHSENKPDTFLIATFERNMGNDPKKSVTAACGTGSTFAAAMRMRQNGLNKLVARCGGGDLIIEKMGDSLYMTGETTLA